MQARSKRIRPSTDDKILTSWNALMLKGYLDAFHATGNPHYLNVAKRDALFLKRNMQQKDGSLRRNYKNGKASIEAFLDDYALLADAYIALYQATFEVEWLQEAKALNNYALQHFYDETSGLFYDTSNKAAPLAAWRMELTDNVIPASNSVMTYNLYRLGEFFYTETYIEKARMMLIHVVEQIPKGGPYYANWARLMGLMAYGPFEVAIMGEEAVAKSQEMQRHYLPTSLFMGGTAENLPLLENKGVAEGIRIQVCRNKSRKMPVKEVRQALDLIAIN